MKIGIVSDTHNNIDLTRRAVELFREAGVGMVIHAGDITSPKILGLFEGFDCRFVLGNGDLDVDFGDLEMFTSCGTGPALPYAAESLPPGCLLAADEMGVIAADHDADLDVDMTDFGVFQRCYSGEGVAADPYCACR